MLSLLMKITSLWSLRWLRGEQIARIQHKTDRHARQPRDVYLIQLKPYESVLYNIVVYLVVHVQFRTVLGLHVSIVKRGGYVELVAHEMCYTMFGCGW